MIAPPLFRNPREPALLPDAQIAVVIPTYRRAGMLGAVLSPHLADPVVSEVVVVDDGSDDDTPAVCQRLAAEHPKLVYLRLANQGESGARIAGARAANADVLLVLDDDVKTEPGVPERHLRWHRETKGRLVLLGYMPPAVPRRRSPGDFPIHLYGRSYESVCRGYERDPTTVLTNLWAGHFSVRRRVLAAIEAPTAQLYRHSDQLMGWDLLRAGCTGRFDRTLGAQHLYSRSPNQFFRECVESGRSRAALANVAPSSDAIAIGSGLSALPSRVLDLVAAAPSWSLWGLHGLVAAAGRVHAWRAEDWLARVAAIAETRRGFDERTRATHFALGRPERP